MRIILLVVIALAMLVDVSAQTVPDGTLVFSSKRGIVGRVAKRITGGDQYTHVGIIFGNYVYESDWPRAKRTPVSSYGKRGSTNDYYVPASPIGPQQLNAMRAKAQSMLGQPYRLRGYFRPSTRPTDGTWCSPFVGYVLNAGGSSLSASDRHEPQTLLDRVDGGYRFHTRTRR